MLNAFLFSFNAIMPMILLMALGYYLRSKGFFSASVLKEMNHFAFYYCIPSLMFTNVYVLDGLQDIPIKLMAFVLISLVLLTLSGLFIALYSTNKSSQRGVLVQMSFRSNYAIVGAAMAASLGGTAGEAISATLQAPSILYFNIVAVLFLTIFSEDNTRKINIPNICRSIITNPLILAQIFAIACLAIRGILPLNTAGKPIFTIANNVPWFFSFIKSLAKISSPFVFVLLGAQVRFSSVKNMKKLLTLGNLLRLILAPFLGFISYYLATHFNFLTASPAIVSALLALYGSPSPAVAAVMAEEMNCDGELARQCVIWSTVFSMLTLMLWAIFFRMINWL